MCPRCQPPAWPPTQGHLTTVPVRPPAAVCLCNSLGLATPGLRKAGVGGACPKQVKQGLGPLGLLGAQGRASLLLPGSQLTLPSVDDQSEVQQSPGVERMWGLWAQPPTPSLCASSRGSRVHTPAAHSDMGLFRTPHSDHGASLPPCCSSVAGAVPEQTQVSAYSRGPTPGPGEGGCVCGQGCVFTL